MTAAAEARPADSVRPARLVAALPLATAFTWLTLVYAWQAWLVPSPMIFTDELLYTKVARSLAEHGAVTVRGVPHSWESLAVVARTPAWLLEDTRTAYFAAKLIGVVAMTATIVPAYLLARVAVGRRAALFAAVASVLIPALAYSALLLEEPIAYPFATLAFALAVRALARPAPLIVVAAVAAAAAAPFVRGELLLVPLVVAAAAVVYGWTSDPVRRLRVRVRPLGGLLAVAAVVAAAYAFDRVAAIHLPAWTTAREHPGLILHHAAAAGGAFAIGVGVVPVVATLAALVRPPGVPRSRGRRALASVTAVAVPAFLAYAGAKGAWLEQLLESRVLERNVIYLSPLVFAGLAVWLERPRVRAGAAIAAGAGVLALVLVVPIRLGWPYFEAPAFSLLTAGNRRLGLEPAALRAVAVALVVAAVAAVLLPRALARSPSAMRALVGTVAAFVLLWNAGGELATAAGERSFGRGMLAAVPSPPDWVDRAATSASVLFLGQSVTDPGPVMTLEFWNRDLVAVGSLDATAPNIGTVYTPFLDAAGNLLPDPSVAYMLAGAGLQPVGERVAAGDDLRLFRVTPPLRLQHATLGVFRDGWMGAASSFTRFGVPSGAPGGIRVTVSRPAVGRGPRGTSVLVRAGPVGADASGAPLLAAVTASQQLTLRRGTSRAVELRAPRGAFRVEVTASPTFVPRQLDPVQDDERTLAVQVAYELTP
ncbi:MAG: hypothetical protein ICV64_11160 [Thermoleophilia bacterium]|nr:hypothetical protein [Thermoleophilia bacterium]